MQKYIYIYREVSYRDHGKENENYYLGSGLRGL